MSQASYRPRTTWKGVANAIAGKSQADTTTGAAPRRGEQVEIGGRVGRVALFEPGVNMVEVDWPDGTCDFWTIARWKQLWGEK